jgi:hypothetical protein
MTNAAQQTPSRTYYNALIALMWLALPVIGLRYRYVWDQLPPRLVTHFDHAGRPNGWMLPLGSLEFSLGLTLFLLALFTAILLYPMRHSGKLDTPAWALLGLFYTVVMVESFISDAVLRYNLSQTSIPTGTVVVAIFLSSFAFTAIFLSSQRGVPLAASNVLSEQTHGSRLFAVVFLVPAAAQIAAAVIVPIGGVRFVLGAGALILLIGAAFAWDGFHYIFSPAGVDVRTLGFRLRSIPAADIQNYAVDRWNVLGGYGIRGIGDRRAYVWGNSGVRIRTFEGEVFLGHDRPERIVHDLDVITHNHEAREAGFPS